jgi:hypothetical protein
MSHFKQLYKDRLFTKLLLLLQSEADEHQPSFEAAIKEFDRLSMAARASFFSGRSEEVVVKEPEPSVMSKGDMELEIKMRMMEKQKQSDPALKRVDQEREVVFAVQRALGWRMDVNLVSEYIGGDVLFRNTQETDREIRRLPAEQCESEQDFRGLMDAWNLLVYETSGGAHTDLSFFAGKGPDSRIRQDLQNEKIFYSSDVEAAIEKGKQKIAVDIARVFQSLQGKNKPNSAEDWTTAYLTFLGRVEAYISWVAEQVRR